jgi:cis-3-alkyl-4-acyloxetan-2-one decarboxylase
MVAPQTAGIPRELYPFQGKRLDRDGLSLHYLDEGQGEPVVMLHGNPTWSIYYRSLVTRLRPEYRTIVPDHIGMGLSDKPDDSRYAYRLESRVDDLELLLERLSVRRGITLIMHDWGGMIGMGYASRHPERIARLVLLNTAAFHLPETMRLPLSLRLVRDTRLGGLSVRGLNSFSRAAAHVGCKRQPLSRELREAYCAPYDSWSHRIATLRFVEDIPLRPTDPSYGLVTQVERSLVRFRQTPALICWGERDFVFTPRVLDSWISRWPHAEVHRFPDCGHYVLEDAAEEIGQKVQAFLRVHPQVEATA